MSICANCIENMDLREGKKWSAKQKEINELFEASFTVSDNDITSTRLVGN